MLIVEDHARMRLALRKLLQALYPAFGVREAADGASALALCREHAFRVVLLDLALPDAGGLDLIAPIKALQPECAVIVVSNHAVSTHATPALDAGAFAYVTKHAIFRELTPAIDRALQAEAR
jgi:two-component system invasion response regulator UvrY